MRFLKKLLFLLLIVAVVAFGVLFSVENDQKVPLNLLFIELPEQFLSLWLFSAFALGGVLGLVINLMGVFKIKRKEISLKRQLAKANKQATVAAVESAS